MPPSTSTAPELDAQYRQLREECGLLDRSARGKLTVTGTEVGDFLQGQLTNDVAGLSVGEGCYALLLDRKGHIQSDMRVLRTASAEIDIDTEPEAVERVRRHLETYRIGRDADIEDATASQALLSLIGPRSADLLGVGPLPKYASQEISIAGAYCLAVSASDGLDLFLMADDAAQVRESLLEAGAGEVSAEAAEILRIESGRPRFGAEMSTATMPAEAGIVEDAVSFTKGCYIGQEPVARLHYKGRPNRHLRGLELSAPVAPGTSLRLGEKEVGEVGGSCVSPARGPIALAIVRREAEPGAELIAGEDGVTARVIDLPFG